MAGGAANWLRAFIGGGMIIGVGVMLLKSAYVLTATTPNEAEMYNVRES